jgi:hypothetical protein
MLIRTHRRRITITHRTDRIIRHIEQLWSALSRGVANRRNENGGCLPQTLRSLIAAPQADAATVVFADATRLGSRV